jgi:hypothetical protein
MDSHDEVEPSPQLVLQRVRNRLIEYLQLVASRQAQLLYQASARVDVSTELINQWDDWFPKEPGLLVDPVFTSEERLALARFHSVMLEVVDALPRNIPDLGTFQTLPAWTRLQQAATQALATFATRGVLDEDVEI